MANEGKRGANTILAKTEHLYGYRKKRARKPPSLQSKESGASAERGGGVVTESIEIRRENEKKRSFYRKIGCLVEMDSKNFIPKGGEHERNARKAKPRRTRPNQSERNMQPKTQKGRKNFQSGGGGKKEGAAPRFKTKPRGTLRRAKAKREREKETPSARRERIKSYKKMRFVGLKSKKKKAPRRPAFGTQELGEEAVRGDREGAKTTPISVAVSLRARAVGGRAGAEAEAETGESWGTPSRTEAECEAGASGKTGTSANAEPSLLCSSLSRDMCAEKGAVPREPGEGAEKAEGSEGETEKEGRGEESPEGEGGAEAELAPAPRGAKNVEIHSCRMERDVEKMQFETGSAKHTEPEGQIEVDAGLKFAGGARSPSDMSNDFKSESGSRTRPFDERSASLRSGENAFDIEDLRDFHKKRGGQREAVEEVGSPGRLEPRVVLGEDRRLTLKEPRVSTAAEFKKNFSNAHLVRPAPKEDLLHPKFDSAIPRISRMLQAKSPRGLQGHGSLEFLLTSQADRPRPKMLDVQELTSDMDMIINGIDSLLLTSGPQGAPPAHLIDTPGPLEYSATEALPREEIVRQPVPGRGEGDAKAVTNLLSDEEGASRDGMQTATPRDAELQQMKRELNLKASTQDMREVLFEGVSQAGAESHPFLEPELDRTELRKSLEKYEANLERIEEESNNQAGALASTRERALKQNEDPFEEAVQFQVTREPARRANKPPLLR